MSRLDFSRASVAGRGRRLHCRAKRRRQPLHGHTPHCGPQSHPQERRQVRCPALSFISQAQSAAQCSYPSAGSFGGAAALHLSASPRHVAKNLPPARRAESRRRCRTVITRSSSQTGFQNSVRKCGCCLRSGPRGEAGERGQQARGVQQRIHAVVSDALYLLRVAWCVLHAL